MKLTIGRKLGLGFATLLCLMIVSSGLAYSRLREIRRTETRLIEVRVPSQKLPIDLERDLNQSQNKGRQVILAGADPVRKEAAEKKYEDIWKDVDKDIAAVDEYAPKWTLQENRDLWNKAKENIPKLHDTQRAAMSIASSGTGEAIIKSGIEFTDRATSSNDAAIASLKELADSFTFLLHQNEEELAAANSSAAYTLLIAALVGLGIGIGVAAYMGRSISASTSAVLSKAEAIAAGDLTSEDVKVSSEDELGDLATAMNKMQASLTKMIISVSENAQQVANASEEFSAVSQQITTNSEETSAQANVVSNAIFTMLLAKRLATKCALPVRECKAGDLLIPSTVWIAPGDYHMVVQNDNHLMRLGTHQGPRENFCRPSVDVLFRSVAAVYGASALGVILTGMGQDGLKGCEALSAAGASIIVQDEASSVVWGMPGFVARAGLAEKVLPLDQIGNEIIRRVAAQPSFQLTH